MDIEELKTIEMPAVLADDIRVKKYVRFCLDALIEVCGDTMLNNEFTLILYVCTIAEWYFNAREGALKNKAVTLVLKRAGMPEEDLDKKIEFVLESGRILRKSKYQAFRHFVKRILKKAPRILQNRT